MLLSEDDGAIVSNRSRQKKYFIGTRHLDFAELELLVDAVQETGRL